MLLSNQLGRFQSYHLNIPLNCLHGNKCIIIIAYVNKKDDPALNMVPKQVGSTCLNIPEAAAYGLTTTEDQHVAKTRNPVKNLKKLYVKSCLVF